MQFVSYPHSILKISGSDRLRYLQGRVTQDIKKIQTESDSTSLSPWSLILSPQGKIEGAFYVLKKEDSFILVSDDSDASSRETFLKALFRFKVADQVFSEDLSDTHFVITLFSFQQIEEALIEAIRTKFELSTDVHIALVSTTLVRRGDLFCLDIIAREDVSLKSELTKELSRLGVESVSFDVYDISRIKAGFPLSNKDITSQIFAPDLPVSRYVSFNKGCYAGQEVVEMATARGRPNRTLVKISGSKISASDAITAHDELLLFVKNGDKLKKSGFITSFVFDEDETITALGYVKTAIMDEDDSSFFLGKSETDVISVTVTAVS